MTESPREKLFFSKQLKSARIKFVPKLCPRFLRLFDKHIPLLGYPNFIIHTEKTFLRKQKKKKKKENEFIQIVRGKKYVQKYSEYRWIKK